MKVSAYPYSDSARLMKNEIHPKGYLGHFLREIYVYNSLYPLDVIIIKTDSFVLI